LKIYIKKLNNFKKKQHLKDNSKHHPLLVINWGRNTFTKASDFERLSSSCLNPQNATCTFTPVSLQILYPYYFSLVYYFWSVVVNVADQTSPLPLGISYRQPFPTIQSSLQATSCHMLNISHGKRVFTFEDQL
jgi:hypothetical protein